MKKEFEELEEGPEANIRLDLLRATLKKIPNWKPIARMEYMDSGKKKRKFTSIHGPATE